MSVSETTNGELAPPQVVAHLLDDLPADEDAFGGPHLAVAEAMARVIEEEKGGKVIALEGGWGSGKSSVVKMLKARLTQGGGDTEVFDFDAWAHEGDPLRRAFLDELTERCSKRFKPDVKTRWERKRNTEIRGVERTTAQTTTPQLRSKWPILFLMFGAIFPVALVGLGAVARFEWGAWWRWWFAAVCVLTFLAALPAVLLFCLFVYCRKQDPSRLERAGRLISLWKKEIEEHTNTTAHETAGPSSIEFQRYFSELLAEHLDDTKRRLVLVLDNLDRVPTETARALWGTLRLFADSCEKNRGGWGDRVWLVVPYDPSAAARIWDGTEHAPSSRNGPRSASPLARSARTSVAFMDKAFQVRFDVPPLLLADWQDFLYGLLKRSLGSISKTDAHAIYSLYSNSVENSPPTPRSLKLFVNDLAALRRRFGTTFPLPHLALYAILRRDEGDIRDWLLTKPDDRKHYEHRLDDTRLADSLCAIAHGVKDVARARALLLRQPILTALAQGNSDEFAALLEVHGFWQELERICHEGAGVLGIEVPRVANALQVVETTGVLEADRHEVTRLRHFLVDLVCNAQWQGLDRDAGNVAARVVRLKLGERAVTSLLHRLVNLPTAEAVEKKDPNDWIAGARLVAGAMVAAGAPDASDARIQVRAVPAAIPILTKLFELDEKHRNEIAGLFELEGVTKDLVGGLVPTADAEWSDDGAKALRFLLLAPGVKVKWEPVVEGVAARFRANVELTPGEVERLATFLRHMEQRHPKLVRRTALSLGKDNIFLRRLHNYHEHLASSVAATLVRWTIESRSLSAAAASPPGAAQGLQHANTVVADPGKYPPVVSEFVSHCQAADESGTLHALLVEGSAAQALILAVLDGLREQQRLGAVLTAPVFVADNGALDDVHEGDRLDQLCSELLADDAFTASLPRAGYGDDELWGHRDLVRKGALTRNSEYAGKLQEFFNAAAPERWRTAFKDKDSMLELLVAMREQDGSFQVAGKLHDAVQSLLSEVLNGTTEFVVPEAWDTVCAAVPKNWQATMAGVLIEMADHPDRELTRIVPLFAEPLLKAAAEHDKASFVRNAWRRMVESGDRTSLEWSARLAEMKPAFWKNTPEDDRESFRQTLAGDYQSADEQRRDLLVAIGKPLKLSVVLEQEAESAPDAEGAGDPLPESTPS